MTASQSCKSVPHVRLCSGHGRARSEIRQPSQIVRQLVDFDTTRRSFIGRFTVAQPVASARCQSTNSPAAPKSP
jgi:hypothetical protein